MIGSILAYGVMFVVLVGIIMGGIWFVSWGVERQYYSDNEIREYDDRDWQEELRDLRIGDKDVDSCFERKVRELGIENPVFFTAQELGCY